MTKDHRCSRCGLLLCKEAHGELVIRDQKHQHTFSGGVLRTICRRCQSLEVIAPAPMEEQRPPAHQAQ